MMGLIRHHFVLLRIISSNIKSNQKPQTIKRNVFTGQRIGNEDQHIHRYIQVNKDSMKNERENFDGSLSHIDDEKMRGTFIEITNFSTRNYRKLDLIAKQIGEMLQSDRSIIDATGFDFWFYMTDILFKRDMKAKYLSPLLINLANHKVRLSRKQLLRLLFLVNLNRDQNGILKAYKPEILNMLDEASFEDVTVLSAAYFKTKTPVTDLRVLTKIIDITGQNLSKINFEEPGFCTVIKCIRYSHHSKCFDLVQDLITKLSDISEQKSVFISSFNISQTIKLMETYRIYNYVLLKKLANYMYEKIDQFRIKDIQYIITSLSNFDYCKSGLDDETKKLLDKVSDNFISSDRVDAKLVSRHIVPLLRAMAILGYYNDELITYSNELLGDQENFRRAQQTVLECDKSAMLFYVSTRIDECQTKFLEGRRQLMEQINSSIERFGTQGTAKKDSSIGYLSYILAKNPKWCTTTASMKQVVSKLLDSDELRDPSYNCSYQYTMPHQNYSDPIVTKDCQAPGNYDAETYMPKRVPAGDRVCLLMNVSDHDFIDSKERLSGYKRFNTRLLNKLGYNVVYLNLDKLDVPEIVREIKSALADPDVISSLSQ